MAATSVLRLAIASEDSGLNAVRLFGSRQSKPVPNSTVPPFSAPQSGSGAGGFEASAGASARSTVEPREWLECEAMYCCEMRSPRLVRGYQRGSGAPPFFTHAA